MAAVASERPNHFAERYGLPVATTVLAAAVPSVAGKLLSAAIASLGITLPYFSEIAFHLTRPVSCVVVGLIGLAVVVAINSRPAYAHRAGVAHSISRRSHPIRLCGTFRSDCSAELGWLESSHVPAA